MHQHNNKNHCGSSSNLRARILADPRIATFVCSIAKSMVMSGQSAVVLDSNDNSIVYILQEFSSIVLALEKLRIAPLQNVLPVDITIKLKKRLE